MSVLKDRNILITSGPTWAPIDAVRYIGNRSSGRLGTALAMACYEHGANVTLMAGPGSIVPEIETAPVCCMHRGQNENEPRQSLIIIRFETFAELKEHLDRRLEPGYYDAVIQAVAALDYLPETETGGKIPSDREKITLRLVRAPKLIEAIKQKDPSVCLIGCKLEAGIDDETLLDRAEDLHRRSGAELVIANRMEDVGVQNHQAMLVSWPEDVRVITGPLDGREAIAAALVEWLAHNLPGKERKES